MPKKSRRSAALKGWRTRRKNAERRSSAARRGWETRKRRTGRDPGTKTRLYYEKVDLVKKFRPGISEERTAGIARRVTIAGTIWMGAKEAFHKEGKFYVRVSDDRKFTYRQYRKIAEGAARLERIESYQKVYNVDYQSALKMDRERQRAQKLIDRAKRLGKTVPGIGSLRKLSKDKTAFDLIVTELIDSPKPERKKRNARKKRSR